MARESGRARRIVSKEKLMSIAAVSSSSIYQELQSFSQQRAADVQQLGKDLTAGNLANAQQDYTTLQTLGQSGPSANGDVFGSRARTGPDRKSTRLNSSHLGISYAVFCL